VRAKKGPIFNVIRSASPNAISLQSNTSIPETFLIAYRTSFSQIMRCRVSGRLVSTVVGRMYIEPAVA
jgi:hypothetical protein